MIGGQKWSPFFMLYLKIVFNFRYIYMRVKVTIPNDLSEIKLHQYQKFLKVQENNNDDVFLTSKMMEIFCGIKLTDAIKMRATDVHRITAILTEMFEQKPKLKQRFVMNGVEYGFVPNLDDMTLGEYIDLDTYLGNWEKMEIAMNVLYRPIENKLKDKYTIKEYTAENPEIMQNMPMDAVLGSILFFYRLGIDLSKTMTNYLEQEEDRTIHLQDSLVRSGDGINQFTHSLKEILEELKISLN
jgi:hypothetical protein